MASAFILIILTVMTGPAGHAQVWEALADSTQLFTANCTGTATPPKPKEAQQTEAGVRGECKDCAVRTDPVAGLLKHSELIADDTYLAALARERSLNHTCAVTQLDKALAKDFETYAADTQSKLEALSHSVLERLRTITANARLKPTELLKRKDGMQKANQEIAAAIAAIQNSIPFSSHPIMAEFISRTVQGALKDATSNTRLTLRESAPQSLGPEFRAKLRSVLGEVHKHLLSDKKNLEAGVNSLGASLDRGTRESLAQDRDLIEAFLHHNQPLKPLVKTAACRVNNTYGAGAEARDQALLVGTVGLAAAGGALGLVSRGIGVVTSSARLASARGLMSANSARIFGSLAVHTGRTALAVGTAAGFRETASACLNSQQVVPGAGKGNRCDNYSVKAIVADNCYLAAGLTALGTVANVPQVQRLVGRLLGRAATPASRAEDVVGRKLSPEQQGAVQRAHQVGLGEKGADGSLAGVGNYTDAQLREKAKILKDAGFNEGERRRLIESGVVGLRRGELPPGMESPYVSYMGEDNRRYAARFLGADDSGYLLELPGGSILRVAPNQLSSFKPSTTARMGLERGDNVNANAFRDNYVAGNLSGDQAFVSVSVGQSRLPARFAGSDEKGNLMFDIYNPATGKREVRALTNEELLSARQSEGSRGVFAEIGPAPAGQSTRIVQRQFEAQPGRAVGDEDIARLWSPRTFREGNGAEVRFNTSTPASARDRAVTEGRLHEIRASQPRQLDEGSYTYVITRDGQLVVGRVDDSFEYGVKHSSLARGREVVSAGELRVGPDGHYQFNAESGTFVRPLMVNDGVDAEQLAERTANSLKHYLGGRGMRTNQVLVPRTPPTRERLQQLCLEVPFCAVNAVSCRQVFGPQICH